MKLPKAAERWWVWRYIGVSFCMGPDYFAKVAPMFFRIEHKPPSNDNGWLR